MSTRNSRPKQILFLHGGPGMNSCAEERILGPLFAQLGTKAVFWNEPSRSRPDHPEFSPSFDSWISSARSRLLEMAATGGPVHLVAESFGAFVSTKLAADLPDALAHMTFVAPTLDLMDAFMNVLRLAMQDLTSGAPDLAADLAKSMSTIRGIFDSSMERAFRIALQDPVLFGHYWLKKEVMADYFEAWQSCGLSLDTESFFAVCRGISGARGTLVTESPIKVPTVLVFGKADPISIRATQERLARSLFASVSAVEFESSAHFPHLEEAEHFLRLLAGHDTP